MLSINYNPKKLWSSKNKKNKFPSSTNQDNNSKYLPKKKSRFEFNFFKNILRAKTNLKSDLGSILSPKAKKFSSSNNKQSYPISGQSSNMKVFAPKALPDNIVAKVIPARKSKFSFGFKPVKKLQESLHPRTFFGFMASWQKEFKLWLAKIQLIPRLNQLIWLGSLIVFLMFFVYLCLFDTTFIVKNYEIRFAKGSYLSATDMAKIIESSKNSKLLGIIPNNQYWFLNSQNLTTVFSKNQKEIRDVKVIDRVWPNSAILEITTEPILLTLGINNGEYWRISQSGEVLSKDDSGLREKLVTVDRPISLNKSGVTLQNYSFQDDLPQLNRFWFINWLWKLMDLLNYKVISTTLPSLFDTDVILTLDSGTKLYFDSTSLAQESQKKRVETVLDSKYRTEINLGEINYFDFRISRKVYICLQNRECTSN